MSQDRIPTSSVVFAPIPTCPSVSWNRVHQREASHSFSTMVRGAIRSRAVFSILAVICTLHVERIHVVENGTLIKSVDEDSISGLELESMAVSE